MIRSERGAVTAELAIGLLAVVVVLAALCSVVVVGVAQVRVTDAAAAGARLAARGESDGSVRSATARLAGDDAAVLVRAGAELTEVTVSRAVPLLLPGRPSVRVDSSALAVSERAAAEGSG